MQKRRGLLILRGTSFRYKGTHGSLKSVFGQIQCTLSHLRLIKKTIKKYDVDFDIALDTNLTNFEILITLILRKYLVYKNVFAWSDCSQIDGILRFLSQIQTNIFEYDYILIMRNDVVIFNQFIDNFNPNDEIVKFPFVHSHRMRRVYGTSEHPIVGDAFMYFPRKYYPTLAILNDLPSGFHMHDIVHLIKEANFEFEYGFYCNTYHDTNTEKEWNPLYKISGRPHTKHIGSDLSLTYPKDY